MGSDDATHYSASVVLGYMVGIVVSFLLNHRYTFGGGNGTRDWSRFTLFIGVAMVGLTTTWLISLLLRYGLPLPRLVGSSSAGVAFAVATVLSSLVTYPLNALFVFGKKASVARTTMSTSVTK